ncbi:MAG: L-arabinose isomerase, partial [Frankiales bacterium]|nr:L-arabinose isomerase [Frankiales bacterium]
ETLAQVAEQSQAVAAVLQGAAEIPLPIVWKPVLKTADAIRQAMVDATAERRCAGVIIWMHTFSPAKMWIGGLDALRKPLLHFHTQYNEALPWADIDMDFMNLNQAAHGDREFGFIETRMRVRRKTVVGHANDPACRSRIADWARAAVGFHTSQNLRLARFGDNMRDVAVTEADKVEAQMRFGMSVNTFPVNELVAAVDTVDDAAIDALCATYAELYDLMPELAQGGERHESLRYGARLEVALRGFLEAGGCHAFTTNFEDLGGLRQLPGLAVQRLMADGYGFGGEGDWKTSALVAILKSMDPGGATSFMEDYTYHLGPGEPLVLGAHMLEVCPTIAGDKPRVEIHPLGIGGREDPVRLVFRGKPGSGYVVGLLDLGERFRLVANEIEVVPPPEPLPKLPIACAVWRPAPDLATSAECWLMAGGPHHTAMTTSVPYSSLEDLALMLDVELLRIGDDTTVRNFSQEVRWNQAYHRLALRL